MTKTVVALYDSVEMAERAVRDLRDAGVPDREISLMAADAHGEYARSLKGDESTATEKGLGVGAALGGLGGLLVGLGALTLPGIGPVVAAGPLATGVAALAGAGAGALAGGAAGGLLGALVDAGLPEDKAEYYAEGVRRGGTLLAARVADERADEMRRLVERHDPVDVEARASSWREEGWSGYDPQAGPHSGEPRRASAGLAGRETAGEQGRPKDAGQQAAMEDYGRFTPAFRGHYQTHLAQSGFQYEHYEPAYQYGLTLGNYEPYRGLDWMQIEHEARRAWEDRNPNTWDRVHEAVRFGWERVRQPVR